MFRGAIHGESRSKSCFGSKWQVEKCDNRVLLYILNNLTSHYLLLIEYLEGESNTCTTIFTTKQSTYFFANKIRR